MAKKKVNNDLVPWFTMKDNGKYKDDITVGWNGKIYKVQRGKEVMIPREVREILEHSRDQDNYTADLTSGMEEEFLHKNI